jgi:hypothetical protein
MGLTRKTGLKRMPMKSKTPARDWSEARDKVEEEGRCRACLAPDGEVDGGDVIRIQAAHVIGREHDEVKIGPKGGEVLFVRRESVVPLCQFCHIQYDARRLDLLPYLFLPEQVRAVEDAGGIASAYRRITGERS